MHINVRCPQCDAEYQLKPEMRGQRMRCTNSVCRTIIDVDACEQSPRPVSSGGSGPRLAPVEMPPAQHWSGSVGDLIPILPAESVQDPLPELPPAASVQEKEAPVQDTPSWREPPPVRRHQADAAPPARQEPLPEPKPPAPKKAESLRPTPPDAVKPAKKPATERVRSLPKTPPPTPPAAGPAEVPAGTWEPPPVRRAADDANPVPAIPTAAPSVAASDDPVAPRRKGRQILLGAVAVSACAVAAVIVLLIVFRPKTEQELFDQAEQFFTAKKYDDAQRKYAQLAKDFPDSERTQDYRRLESLTAQLSAAKGLNPDLDKTFEGLRDFVQNADNAGLVEERKPHLEEAFLFMAGDLADRAKNNSDTRLVALSREALGLADRFNSSPDHKAKIAEVRQRLAETEGQIAHAERVKNQKAALAKLVDQFDRFENAHAEAVRALPELRDDAEVKKLRAQTLEKFQAKVVWKPATNKSSLRPTIAGPARDPWLIVAPNIPGAGAGLSESKVAFFLARGVLYALDQSNGGVRWATRVGIDTTALPLRREATEIAPELAFVLSSETQTVTARYVQTGQIRWQHQLTAPCLGTPLLVDQRVYVPTYDGKVHVLEIIEGSLLGWYELGQPLTVGGVKELVLFEGEEKPRTYLYFPADQRYVFVLDASEEARNRPCVDILRTEHPSGSLRSEPVLISREDQRKLTRQRPDEWPDLLMLYQADELNSMKVRYFSVPRPQGAQALAGANEVTVPVTVPGWSWFPPYQDPEKLVQVTDKGALGVLGIKQPGNQDPDLFLEISDAAKEGRAVQPGRAQVVHVAENDLWVLDQGALKLRHFDRFNNRILNVWPQPLQLGSPLHASQVNEARKTAFVATQELARPTCWAAAVDTSVDSDVGKLRWKRQLGLLCQGEPFVSQGKVLTLDDGGGLLLFDPAKHPVKADEEWQVGGELVAPPPEDGTGRQFLLPARDSQSVLAITEVPGKLIVRKYEPGTRPTPQVFAFAAGLAGTPGWGPDRLIVPGRDGKLWFVPLSGAPPEPGPEWRAEAADRNAEGHVLQLAGNDFVTTNGGKGMTLRSWGGGFQFKEGESYATSDRIIAPPLAVPGDDVSLMVVDVRGTVTLLHEAVVGGARRWVAERSWKLGGRVTAGPFLRGKQVGCVVGVSGERLVWIDPAQDAVLWQYSATGDTIVGQPQLVQGMVLVALRSGKFLGLDPTTGKPVGPVHAVNIAPAAAPVPFGEGRAFAPLSDGTVLLLSVKDLRGPAAVGPAAKR